MKVSKLFLRHFCILLTLFCLLSTGFAETNEIPTESEESSTLQDKVLDSVVKKPTPEAKYQPTSGKDELKEKNLVAQEKTLDGKPEEKNGAGEESILNKDDSKTKEVAKDKNNDNKVSSNTRSKVDRLDEDIYRAVDPDGAYAASESRENNADDLESGFHMDDFHPSHVYTFPVLDGSEECFYAEIVAELPAQVRGAYFVSSGGSMEISFRVDLDLNGSPMNIVKYLGKSEETFEFTATRAGEYSFCFKNPQRGYNEKVVTFAVHIFHHDKSGTNSGPGYAKAEHVVTLAASVKDIQKAVAELEAEQLFLKERTTRHMMIQDSTEWRVAWYTVFESAFMFLIAFGQVWYVQQLINQRVWV